jgi:hypothetical protein
MKKEFKELQNVFNFQEANVCLTQDFDSLSEEAKQVLEPQLIESAALGFKRPLTEEFAQDVKNHIRGGDLFIVEQEGAVSGFAMLERFPDKGVIYIAGIVKKPTAPSRIIEKVVEYYLKETGFETVTVRTQNDRVLEILVNTCSSVVSIDRLANLAEVDLLTNLGLINPKSDLDIDYLIHRGYYGSPMIQDGIRRRTGNIKVKALTDRLDYFRGDAVYGIGYRK